MIDRLRPGQASIDQITRRGFEHLEAASRAGADAPASSSREDRTRPGDGVAEATELRFHMHVAESIVPHVDNHRGVPAPEAKVSK